jgi:hypothetical protein
MRYGKCVKRAVHRRFDNYEKEYRNWNREMRDACFAKTGKGDKCPFPKKEQKLRPLAGEIFSKSCKFCNRAAVFIEASIIRANSSTKKCINKFLLKHIQGELRPCMEQKHGKDFKFPKITSWDSGEYAVHDTKVESWNKYLLMGSKLEFCETHKRHKDKFPKTKECLDNIEVDSRWHCYTHSQCITRSGRCADDIQTFNNDLCQCLDESRQSVRQNIRKLKNIVAGSLNGPDGSIEKCTEAMMRELFPPSAANEKKIAIKNIFDGIATNVWGSMGLRLTI